MYILLQIARVVLAVMLAVALLPPEALPACDPGNASRAEAVVGARGDGRTDDSAAFQRAFGPEAAGAGQVRVPTETSSSQNSALRLAQALRCEETALDPMCYGHSTLT